MAVATCEPMGDSAVVVELGNAITVEVLQRVLRLTRRLEAAPCRGLRECVSAYATVTIRFDPLVTDTESLIRDLQPYLTSLESEDFPQRRIEIPVCYGGEFGPDLEFVASHHGLTAADVIALHTSAEYVVYAIGFMPGFPYLGGLPPQLATPRLERPRLSVPAGSVGIGGEQTGIYPLATPGGWRLIGRTPGDLFRPQADPPCRLQTGDRIRFRSLSSEEFREIQEQGIAWESR